MIWKLKNSLKYVVILILSVCFLSSLIASPVGAVSGKLGISNTYNSNAYYYIRGTQYTWLTTTFGSSFATQTGFQPYTNVNFTVPLSGPSYLANTDGYFEFTLEGYTNWNSGGANLGDAVCEVWSTGSTPRAISSQMQVSRNYYKVPADDYSTYAVDYRCNFSAVNLTPAYAYVRIGPNNPTTATIPFMGYNTSSSPRPPGVSPRIRNVSLTYSTGSTDSNLGTGLLEQGVGDLINGQKNIFNEIGEVGDKITNSIDDVNSTLKDTQEFLTDDTPPSVNTDSLSGSAGWLPAGPLDSIVTLPIQFIQGIVNLFTGTQECVPLSIPIALFDTSFYIPCLSTYFSQAGWTTIWEVAGAVISAFMIFFTLKWLYEYVDLTLTFRENTSGIWGGL